MPFLFSRTVILCLVWKVTAVKVEATLCFRYKKFSLGNDIELIVRCEHDAVMYGVNGELQYINIKTLNEWDPRVS